MYYVCMWCVTFCTSSSSCFRVILPYRPRASSVHRKGIKLLDLMHPAFLLSNEQGSDNAPEPLLSRHLPKGATSQVSCTCTSIAGLVHVRCYVDPIIA
ncbi:hypothetical protein M405DRAFT_87209 [Rhizopogon salebrosus TDB-379]|nr:hypothetical protein M405DRAFT_87209 [Rhizopogon salebrosus TDB-379]